MKNDQREANYRKQNRGARLSARQQRRIRHKTNAQRKEQNDKATDQTMGGGVA
jgi:hypothetical protein